VGDLMRQLHWYLARLSDKVGLVAGLACLLLLVIVFYAFYLLIPAQQKLQDLELQLETMPPAQHVIYAYESPSEQFFSEIPHIDDVTARIETMFNVAKEQGIVINEVVYKDEQRPGEDIVHYTMNFSISESYPVTKKFIVNTLAELPYLALEQLTFERDETNKNKISTHVQFALYLVR